MFWILAIAVAWAALTLPASVVLGRAVRRADHRHQPMRRACVVPLTSRAHDVRTLSA